jgi:hypothetical protein
LALRELLQMAGSARGRFLQLGENDYLALTDSFASGSMIARIRRSRCRWHTPECAGGTCAGRTGCEAGEIEADAAWREQVNKLDALADFYPQVPSTLQAELRDYQLAGYQWLRHSRTGVSVLVWRMTWAGKTVQTLALLLDRAPGGPALVVAPISVAMNWQAEVMRFAPTLKVRAYHSHRSLADQAHRSGHCQLWHVAVGCRGFRCATLAQRGAG